MIRRLEKRQKDSQSSLLQDYKDLLLEPDLYDSPECDFDYIAGLSKNFHVMQPIVDDECIASTWFMLQSSGYNIISLDELLERDFAINGLMSCNCGLYLHYAWCHHSCSVAICREIVLNVPGPEAKAIMRKGKQSVGRPPKALGGGAFGF